MVRPILRVKGLDGKVYDILAIRGISPHIGENGNWWIGNEDTGVAASPVSPEEFEQLKQDVADLKYVPIDITKITDNVVTMEMGSTVQEVTVSWELNKEPVSQTLDGETVDASLREKTIAGLQLRENKSFTLVVTDERNATDSASTAVTFLNGIYYGALATGAAPDSSEVLGLTRKLQSGRGVTFAATPGSGKRPAYACPSRYGTPKFSIGGFEYSWTKLGTIDFTNASGYTEQYDIWQHPQDVTGSMTITVS
jgi:hypothetical protein